jgi:hypothetical protein
MALTPAERQRNLRERRKASLAADPAALRDAAELLSPAIAATLSQLDLGSEHAAAAKLAEQYARIIDQAKDQAWAMRWIGPLLLDCLTQLGATPMSKPKQKQVPAGSSRLDQLRQVRRQTFPGA